MALYHSPEMTEPCMSVLPKQSSPCLGGENSRELSCPFEPFNLEEGLQHKAEPRLLGYCFTNKLNLSWDCSQVLEYLSSKPAEGCLKCFWSSAHQHFLINFFWWFRSWGAPRITSRRQSICSHLALKQSRDPSRNAKLFHVIQHKCSKMFLCKFNVLAWVSFQDVS